MKKSTFTLLILAAAAALLPSCNTMVGVGRDFRRLGEGMESKAYQHNNGNTSSTYTPPSKQYPAQ